MQAMRISSQSKRGLTKRIAFTVRTLEAATSGGKPRVYIFDSRTPGLALQVTARGSKSFYLCRRIDGRPERIRIGGFPEVSVEQARRIVATWQGQIASGLNPAVERQRISKSITLGALWERWKEDHAQPRLRKSTITTDESRFKTCLGDWQTRKISTIRESDVQAKHSEIGRTHGQVSANRTVQLLRRLFYFARIEPNPAKGINLFRESTRSRFLQPDELPRLFAALESEPNQTIKDFIFLALWTGQRRANVQSMRWGEINLAARTWTIPPEKSKARQPIIVHLTDPAMEILQRRQGGEYVLSGRGASGHLEEPKTAWRKILHRAGIENLTIHDLRRSLASWMAIGGTSLPIIGAALGHKSPSATAIYARLHGSAVAASLDNTVKTMVDMGQVKV